MLGAGLYEFNHFLTLACLIGSSPAITIFRPQRCADDNTYVETQHQPVEIGVPGAQ